MSKKSKIIMWVVIAVLVVAVVAIILSVSLNSGTSIDFATFKTYVDNYGNLADTSFDGEGNVTADSDGNLTIYVTDSNGDIVLNADGSYKTETVSSKEVIYSIAVDNYNYTGYSVGGTTYTSTGPSLYSYNDLVDQWVSYGIKISYSDPNSGSYLSSIMSFVMVIVLCVIFWLIIRSAAGGGAKGNSFAHSKARVSTNIKVRFTDVAGAEEEKLELAEVVEFLKQPKKFSDLGARIPKGVLLVGPPGTGKTLFAKAVAGEAGVPFFSVSGSDFVEMYVGVGASRVRDLFDMAKKNQPCIIFIDEIDAVGRHRGAGLGGGNDEREQTLNQILVQMDGFESNEGVIVMAATNRSDILDPALTRPGRFDRQIFVNLPDVKGREQILKVHSRNKPLAPDVNFKTIARITSGFSGADLANLLNEAAILAARANKKFIGNTELYEGVNKVLMGPQKKSHIVTESDKRITAYHEAGHAIVARKCKHCDPVQEVSIIPRGNAAGYTMTRPDNDDAHVSREKLNDFICMALGGRVAEELVIKDITTGASNDLERVTETAKRMVTEWGMSEKLGLVTYGSNSQTVFLGKDMETHNAYSEETARLIDEEMHSIIDKAHERAEAMLTENRSILDNMARVLIERETIYTEEVDMLMEGKSYDEVIKFMDDQDSSHMENPFKRYE
ncbi:MAG: ATP-dependent zinc metalloprotease FtsH [Clostridia bacterium]|nr:ATP-dependent zinc metalloprotease FtsH [Clostridia bacterium]